MSRPQSARERKIGTGTGKTNAVQPGTRASPVLKSRPKSASPSSPHLPHPHSQQRQHHDGHHAHSNQSSAGSSRLFNSASNPSLTHEDMARETMKKPFFAKIYSDDMSPRRKTFLPPSRFPTVPPPMEPTPVARYVRPPIAPKWFIDYNQKPTVFDRADFRIDVDDDEKAEMVDEFIQRNKYRMSLYNYAYKNKKLNEIREEMMNADKFLNQMTTYAYRERSYVSGTSSARMKSLIDQSHQESMGEAKDPFLLSLRSTRGQHNDKLSTILDGRSAYKSDFSRGFRHAPEYGNFSNFNGILKSNENSVLQR